MNQDDFVDKIHYYGLLHTICTREISTVGKNDPHMLNQLDKEVRDTWNADPSNPLYHPADNAEAELEFYKKCDTICKTEAHSVQDWLKVSFACYAAIEVLRERGSSQFPNADELVNIGGKRAYDEYMSKYGTPNTFLSDGTPAPEEISVSAFFPAAEPEVGTDLNAGLVDQTFYFYDTQTSQDRECKIVDCGTSHLRGDWFEVVLDGGPATQITAREMKEILDARKSDV